MKNFPVKVNGKEYWISRSVATVCMVFKTQDKNKLYLMVEKRGKGTPDFQGCWCFPCGYLEYDVTLEENMKKEIFEETGMVIDENELELISINSSPKENHQNVSVTYVYYVNNENFDLAKAYGGEMDEVDEVQWLEVGNFVNGELQINYDKINNISWAFNHKEKLLNYLNEEYII